MMIEEWGAVAKLLMLIALTSSAFAAAAFGAESLRQRLAPWLFARTG